MFEELSGEINRTIKNVQSLLSNNQEWIPRYAKYAAFIISDYEEETKNPLPSLPFCPSKIHPGLEKFSSISRTDPRCFVDVRYLGQNVFQAGVGASGVHAYYWDEEKHAFSNEPEEWKPKNRVSRKEKILTKISKIEMDPHHHEYAVESSMKRNLSSGEDDSFSGFQPIQLPRGKKKKFFFQMPTPITASNAKNGGITYSGSGGGGIDLLARCNIGCSPRKTSFCVLEIKDTYSRQEPPEKAILQAVAYATFIQRLLRTPVAESKKWNAVFRGDLSRYNEDNYSKTLEKPLDLRAIIAMPFGGKRWDDTDFQSFSFLFEGGEKDTLRIGFMDLDVDSQFRVTKILRQTDWTHHVQNQ